MIWTCREFSLINEPVFDILVTRVTSIFFLENGLEENMLHGMDG